MENAMIENGKEISAPQGFIVGSTAGRSDHRLSSQWRDRPDDQKFLDLDSLYAFTKREADLSHEAIVDPRDIRVEAERTDFDSLSLRLPRVADEVLARPTHYSFGQLCHLMGDTFEDGTRRALPRLPAQYLRQLPGFIAGINVQYALQQFRGAPIKAYVRENGQADLRAMNGVDYGRVRDYECVAAVQRIAGNGIGDTRWKIPGVMDWGTMHYDPNAPVTKQSTTLFASDRDVFMFLTDDTHPIEIGKTHDGKPDYLLRGFMVWNSEVGARSLGVATFYYRAVCCNRILWGIEGYQEIRMIHSKNAPDRFASEIAPALESFADARDAMLLRGVKTAREAIVAGDNEARRKYLKQLELPGSDVTKVLELVEKEEGHEASSVWDFVQGITALARDEGRQDERLGLERKASKLLNALKV